MNSTDGDFGEIQQMVDLRYHGYDDPRHNKRNGSVKDAALRYAFQPFVQSPTLLDFQTALTRH